MDSNLLPREFRDIIQEVPVHPEKAERHLPARSLPIQWGQQAKIDRRTDYLMKPYVNPGQLSSVFAPSGMAKTWWVLHLAHRIATGRPFFGHRTRASRVLYLALEGGKGFSRRVRSVLDHHGETDNFAYYCGPLSLLSSSDDIESVINAIVEVDAKFVVVDTLARAMSGANENAFEVMSAIVANADRIRAATGAHVMLVHHSGKSVELGARGHSSLRAAVDLEIEVRKDGDTDQRIARVSKCRDDQDGEKFAFSLDVVEQGLDDEGDPIRSCVVKELDAQVISTTPKAAGSSGDREALRWLHEAIVEHGLEGVEGPPHGVKATTKEVWVDLGVKRSGNARDAVRKQVGRAITKWTELRKLGVSDPYFWVLP